MSNELGTFNFEITSLQQAMDYAKLISDSDLAPKDYKGKPGNVLIAIQYGIEIGLKPMQAIQNIAVINGRPAIWGDAMIGLVQNHTLCEYITEEVKDDIAYCTVKRKGHSEHTYKFSKQDAKTAGLIGKPGPWSQYPERMMQLRARGFALRDKFSDVLKGMAMREEVMDYQDPETRQTKSVAASNHVSKLIEGKSTKIISVDEILDKISHASCIEDLSQIAELAKTLSGNDKDAVRSRYKDKVQSFKSEQVDTETGEITTEEPIVLTELEKIKNKLINAKCTDTLAIAADLIYSIQEEDRPELLGIYMKRKSEFL